MSNKPESAGKKKRAQSNGAKTKPAAIECKVKAAKAMTLRMEGTTFEEIATQCGYNSKQAAYDAVRREIEAITREPAMELVKLDLERLDALWQVPYLKAQAGDVYSLASCLKIMERRAKLLGLDAAVKVAATVDDPKGVLVAGPVLTPEAWAIAAAAQQAALQSDAVG